MTLKNQDPVVQLSGGSVGNVTGQHEGGTAQAWTPSPYAMALAPQDKLEFLLADRMTVVDDAAMECFSRASAPGATMAVREMELR